MISVISLDLDDTLWDNKPTLDYAERTLHDWLKNNLPDLAAHYSIDAMKAHRRELALEEPRLSHDMTLLRHHSMQLLALNMGYSIKLVDEAMSVFLAARNNVTLYDDVIPFLDACLENFSIVALSNGNADVHDIGIGAYFSLTLSPREVGIAKPNPAMFHHLFDQMNIKANSVLHIGDEPSTDILGANSAGVRSVWLNRNDEKYPLNIPPPDMEITSLMDLIPWDKKIF